MDYGKKRVRHTPRCLECGQSIGYGRTDKKYCCEECKNRHNNTLARMSRSAKRKILKILDRNYEILDKLLKAGKDSAWISDVAAAGFNPGYSTYYRKTGRREYYHCFDISYVMTPNRIYCMTKIQNLSLTLPPVREEPADRSEEPHRPESGL